MIGCLLVSQALGQTEIAAKPVAHAWIPANILLCCAYGVANQGDVFLWLHFICKIVQIFPYWRPYTIHHTPQNLFFNCCLCLQHFYNFAFIFEKVMNVFYAHAFLFSFPPKIKSYFATIILLIIWSEVGSPNMICAYVHTLACTLVCSTNQLYLSKWFFSNNQRKNEWLFLFLDHNNHI